MVRAAALFYPRAQSSPGARRGPRPLLAQYDQWIEALVVSLVIVCGDADAIRKLENTHSPKVIYPGVTYGTSYMVTYYGYAHRPTLELTPTAMTATAVRATGPSPYALRLDGPRRSGVAEHA